MFSSNTSGIRSWQTSSARMLLTALLCCAAACTQTSRPPFIKAQVVDVYNNKTDIYNAHILYWWQERGETAFLDTHTLRSKDLITGEVSRASTQQTAVLNPVRLFLGDIERIEWTVTGTGKKMYVYTGQDAYFEAQCVFPEELRVNPQSGLADFRRYLVGSTRTGRHSFDFKLDMEFIRSIEITGVDLGS